MNVLQVSLTLLGAYVLGSVPVGVLIVKLLRGRDIRNWFSGRTGGTNVMRMAGFGAGFFTGLMDLFKGALAVLLARSMIPGNPWVEMGAGLLAVFGHNHSVFLIERKDGKLRFRGGAGGATTSGAALSFWPPTLIILIPIGVAIYYFVGYASITTLSIGVIITVTFLWRALTGLGPWAYVAFGVLVEVLLLWSLRPNIQRLLKGEERVVGWRARRDRKKPKTQKEGGKARA